MPCLSNRLHQALLAVGAWLVLAVPPADAQYRQAAASRAYMARAAQPVNSGATVPNRVGYNRPGYAAARGYAAAPAYAPPTYAPYYGESVAGSYLSGTADVINSQGQFLQQRQQAEQTRQQVEQSKIDTRRKAYDQWLYEREKGPTWEDERQRQRKANLESMRNDPDSTLIWSATALNTILANTQRIQAAQGPGPAIPLEPKTVAQVSVTDGKSQGGVALLQGGRLRWPPQLRDTPFDDGRERIDGLVQQAVEQARTGDVDAKVLRDLNGALKDMRATWKQNLPEMTSTDGIKAMRYLNQLEDAFRTLEQPKVAKYLTGEWAARGNSVAELVSYMTREGLKFAPAVEGAESAYTSLYQSLRAYDAALSQFASRSMSAQPDGRAPQPPAPGS